MVNSIEVAPYLSKLCATLAQSMIGDSTHVTIEVKAAEGSVLSSDAVSIGLIVTEAVINALKHAFTTDEKDGRIVVTYEVTGTDWKLSIADNGMGKPSSDIPRVGLGTSIVNALASQLDAHVDVVTGQGGTILSIVHSVTTLPVPRAA